jgi:hypothetical protein
MDLAPELIKKPMVAPAQPMHFGADEGGKNRQARRKAKGGGAGFGKK